MHTTTAPASSGRERSRFYATEAEFANAQAQLAARVAALRASPPQADQDRPKTAQESCPVPAAASSPPKPAVRTAGRTWHHHSRFPGPGDFRRLDRNDRVRVWVAAQALDRRTHTPGKHGGVLGHTGLIVLRCLLFDFLHLPTGRLDPAYETIARCANLARSTVIEAVGRLKAAGLLEVTRRIVRERVRLPGGRSELQVRQTSNAYRVNYPTADRGQLGDLAAAPRPGGAESGNRAQTRAPTNQQKGGAQNPTAKVPSGCHDSVERACEPPEPAG